MADQLQTMRDQWIASLVERARAAGANITETSHGLKVIAMYPGELAKVVEAFIPVPVESLGRDAPAAEGDQAKTMGDDRVLLGVVANAGRMSDRRGARWSHVVDATGLGSQSSIALCRRFGLDPDENVGGACEEENDDA